MEDFIKVENLKYIYTGVNGESQKALDAINLSVKAGEFLAIIGTNGSGKSTLARHLNAIFIPTEGSCRVAGLDTRVSADVWKIRQQVGMVFQNPDNQIVTSIVEEDVAFGPENLGLPSAEILRRVEEALALVGLTDYRLHSPHLLSGGQKQRLAIAGVLAMEPKCLVLDEPTAMLDPQGRKEVLETVCRLNRERGITVIYVTHYMDEVLRADRLLVMSKGKIIDEGTPARIFQQVEKIKDLGLDVPIAAEIAFRLRKQGIELPPMVITDEDLVNALCL